MININVHIYILVLLNYFFHLLSIIFALNILKIKLKNQIELISYLFLNYYLK